MAVSILYSLAVLFGIWGVYHYLGYRSAKREWRNKVENWYGSKRNRKSIVVLWGDKLDQTRHAQKVTKKLQQANIPLMASEFYGILVVGAMGVTLVLNNMFNIRFPLNLMLAVAVMAGVRYVLFFIRRNKHRERLNDQLPDVCHVLANATRSGMTLTQGINLAARELDEPAKGEFQKLSNELQLGVDFERALRELQQRVPSKDFKLFVATLLIQKKAGGNLNAVLDEMGQTLDERKLLQQEIKTMTAEQRYVSYLVPLLPVFLVLMMNNIVDGFLDPLFSGIGIILLALFLTGTVVTFLLVKKVTNIRV